LISIFCFVSYGPLPRSPLFPYTTLFRSGLVEQNAANESVYALDAGGNVPAGGVLPKPGTPAASSKAPGAMLLYQVSNEMAAAQPDRKSTRLNSSHDQISYAVFCLKKKKT